MKVKGEANTMDFRAFFSQARQRQADRAAPTLDVACVEKILRYGT